jgi:hypothetical protein
VQVIRFTAVLALGALLVGCYTLQPTRGASLEPGTNVALDVTDVGRVALGGSMGPEIAQIEGRLLDADTAGYVVAVSMVRLLRGGSQVWRGEQVRIQAEHVGSAYERRFSRERSLAMGVAVVAGVLALVDGWSLLGLGEGGGTDIPIDTVETRIGRRR